MGKSLPTLAAPNAALLLASQAADECQTPPTATMPKLDNRGQAPRGQRWSPEDNVCLTRTALRLRPLSARVGQATLPVRDNPPLAFGV